jgi:hypothetical protein
VQDGFYVQYGYEKGGWKIKLLLEKHISLIHVCGSRVFGKTNLAFLRKLFLQTYPSVQYDMQGCCEKHVALYQRMNVENLLAHFFNGFSSFGI